MVVENGPRAGLEAVVAEFPATARDFNISIARRRIKVSRSIVPWPVDGVRWLSLPMTMFKFRARLWWLMSRAPGRAAAASFMAGRSLPEYEGERPPAWLVPHAAAFGRRLAAR